MSAIQNTRLIRGLPWATFVLGGAFVVWMAGSVRVPAVPPRAGLGEQLAPALVLARTDRLATGDGVRERLWLLDPAPLFLPSANNVVGPGPEVITDRPGGEAGESFPAALQFTDQGPARGILRPMPLAGPLVAVNRLIAPRWFDGLTRAADLRAEGASAVRVARVEVYRLGEAVAVASMDIAATEGLPAVVWRPLELTVLVDVAGAVGQPVVASTSGVDEIDERIRSIVGRELLPTLLLRAGIYRLEVGP